MSMYAVTHVLLFACIQRVTFGFTTIRPGLHVVPVSRRVKSFFSVAVARQ